MNFINYIRFKKFIKYWISYRIIYYKYIKINFYKNIKIKYNKYLNKKLNMENIILIINEYKILKENDIK